MLCKNCQTEIQAGNAFCSKCGTSVSEGVSEGQTGGKSRELNDILSIMAKPGTSLVLTIAGCFLIILGSFLPWISGNQFLASTLGVEISQGTVTLMAGVLCVAALILVQSDARSKRGIFFLILGALILALVFQSMYGITDHDLSIGAGLWISMVGGLFITGAGECEAMVFTHIVAKSSQPSQK